jgi:hypothetical protein
MTARHEQTIERREDARFLPPPRLELRATLRPGTLVMLVDISARGALVQAARPLRPGARVHLQVITPGRRFLLVASVLRCMVWSLVGEDGVIYRAAVRFDQRVEWAWAEPTRRVQGLPEQPGPAAGSDGKRLPENPLSRRLDAQR